MSEIVDIVRAFFGEPRSHGYGENAGVIQQRAHQANQEGLVQYEETVMTRALALCKNQSPYYNIAPLMELIRQADQLGYAITSKAPVKGP